MKPKEQIVEKWEVRCYDWSEPNVVETFEGDNSERTARDYAEALDNLALRCYVRKVSPIGT